MPKRSVLAMVALLALVITGMADDKVKVDKEKGTAQAELVFIAKAFEQGGFEPVKKEK